MNKRAVCARESSKRHFATSLAASVLTNGTRDLSLGIPLLNRIHLSGIFLHPLENYVVRHIILLLLPPGLCGVGDKTGVVPRGCNLSSAT